LTSGDTVVAVTYCSPSTFAIERMGAANDLSPVRPSAQEVTCPRSRITERVAEKVQGYGRPSRRAKDRNRRPRRGAMVKGH
jgi:hypothetical protein